MPEITLSCTITRTALSLATLELNDHTNFYLAPSTPGPVTWSRMTASSPFVDSDFTIARKRNKVTEEMVLEVRGANAAGVQTNLGLLIAAFSQGSYTLTTTFNGTSYAWSCDAADYQVEWSGPRVVANQVVFRAQVPRSPVPLIGPL